VGACIGQATEIYAAALWARTKEKAPLESGQKALEFTQAGGAEARRKATASAERRSINLDAQRHRGATVANFRNRSGRGPRPLPAPMMAVVAAPPPMMAMMASPSPMVAVTPMVAMMAPAVLRHRRSGRENEADGGNHHQRLTHHHLSSMLELYLFMLSRAANNRPECDNSTAAH